MKRKYYENKIINPGERERKRSARAYCGRRVANTRLLIIRTLTGDCRCCGGGYDDYGQCGGGGGGEAVAAAAVASAHRQGDRLVWHECMTHSLILGASSDRRRRRRRRRTECLPACRRRTDGRSLFRGPRARVL